MDLNSNKNIQIPKKHFVGFLVQETNLPLGLMTPEGKDSASKRRKQQINYYCLVNSTKSSTAKTTSTPNTCVIDNQPMLGFKLVRNTKITSGFGKGDVRWRIEDPRGFEMEISSINLNQILSLCTLEKGEILEKCVWGRLHSENVLIPVSSEVYLLACNNTNRIEKRTNARSVKIGNKVLLRNGLEGIFLGKHYPILVGYTNLPPVSISDKPFYFFAEQKDNSTSFKHLHIYSSLNASEVLDNKQITSNESLDLIHKFFEPTKNRLYSSYSKIIGAVSSGKNNVSIECQLHSLEKERYMNSQDISRGRNLIVKNERGNYFLGAFGCSADSLAFEGVEIDPESILANKPVKYVENSNSFLRRSTLRVETKIEDINSSKYQFFLIKYYFNSLEKNTVSILL